MITISAWTLLLATIGFFYPELLFLPFLWAWAFVTFLWDQITGKGANETR